MEFDLISFEMISTDDPKGLKLRNSFLEGLIERCAWILPDQPGKVSSVEGKYPGFDTSIENMPANAKEGLIGDQSDGTRPVFYPGVIGIDLEHSGHGTPGVGIDSGGRSCQDASWVTFLMAGKAHGDTFKHILVVIHDDVIENFFLVSVESP